MYTLHIIGIMFILLKLMGVLSWTWWIVLSPFAVMPSVMLVGVMVTIEERFKQSNKESKDEV